MNDLKKIKEEIYLEMCRLEKKNPTNTYMDGMLKAIELALKKGIELERIIWQRQEHQKHIKLTQEGYETGNREGKQELIAEIKKGKFWFKCSVCNHRQRAKIETFEIEALKKRT